MAGDENFILKTLNFFSPTNLVDSIVGAITGKSEDLKDNPDPTFMDRVGSAASNSQLISGFGAGVDTVANTTVPFTDAKPLKYVLDFANRTADSFWGGLAYADWKQQSGDDGTVSMIGNIWDGARTQWSSWGQEGHLSAGQIVGAELNSRFGDEGSAFDNIANPLSVQGYNQIDEMSKRSWYGNIAGGVVDLTAGFVGPELAVAKVARAARAGAKVDTLAQAEKAADAFNDMNLDDLKVNRGRSFVRGLTDQAPSPSSHAARLRDSAQELGEVATDRVAAYNWLNPRMSGATESAKRIMAEVAVDSQYLTGPARTSLIGNSWLALMGSERAAKEVARLSPLVVEKMAEATSAPADLGITAKFTEGMLRRYEAGEDFRPDVVMNEVFDTPRQKALIDALGIQVERATEDAVAARGLSQRIHALRPSVRTRTADGFKASFDVERLKESRLNATNQVNELRDQLKAARAEAKANARWSDAADKGARKGPEGVGDAADFNQATGAAKQRIASLEEDLAQARADKALLDSTPLDDGEALAKWREDVTAASAGSKAARTRRDVLSALHRTAKRQLKADEAAMLRVRPTMSASHAWLADIDAMAGTESWVGSVSPTMLERGIGALRDKIGQSYIYDAGDYAPKTIYHVLPKNWVGAIGSRYGRRAVNVNELSVGMQELGMYLRKSKAFDDVEIRKAVDDMLAAPAGQAGMVVERMGDEMVKRMMLAEGFTEAQAAENIALMRQVIGGADGGGSLRSYLSGVLENTPEGQVWVATKEFPGDEFVSSNHMLPVAYLRSHLADTIAFPDPKDVASLIGELKGTRKWRNGADNLAGYLDAGTYWWKMANLVRPGLFFRNMLDTGVRSAMMMGGFQYMTDAIVGARNVTRNTGVRVGDWADHATKGTALERIGARLGPASTAKATIADKGATIDIGGGRTKQFNLYEMGEDGHALAASINATRIASTKGASMSEGLLGATTPIQNKLLKAGNGREKIKAGSPVWSRAYAEHAQELLASPTAKRLIEQMDQAPVDVTSEAWMRGLFDDPKVREEYNRLASYITEEGGLTREDFVAQLAHELEVAFPNPGMAQEVASGALRTKAAARRWVDDNFPPSQQFDVNASSSILAIGRTKAERAGASAKKALDGFFQKVVDDPDFWLVRHPVMTKLYKDQVRLEGQQLLAARRAKFGDDVELTAKDLATIDRRAKTKAISASRSYMYDGNWNTSAHATLGRLTPFINPWYDAMRAYSKLIYDDPQILRRMTGIWNAPGNLSQWMPTPLVVDINGNEVRPGEEPADGGGEKFFVLNGRLGKGSAYQGPEGTNRRRLSADDGQVFKLRQSSFNTILMGETPWLPGWGPAVTVPLQAALNTESAEDLSLWLGTTDNPLVRGVMSSIWPEGQIPRGDVFRNVTPAWIRKFTDAATQGEQYWSNVQVGINGRYMRAMENGEVFDEKKARAEAEKDAQTAGAFAWMTQGIVGLSADSDPAGQFYLARMHELQALDPAVIQQAGYPSAAAMFAAEYPEAKNLTMSFSLNETGIQATVEAQSEAHRLKDMIADDPSMGWFLVGSENIGGKFSQTAYNQQREHLYGPTQQGRKRLESGEVIANTQAGIGWDQYLTKVAAVDVAVASGGYDPRVAPRVKAQIAAIIGRDYPEFYQEYNTRETKLQTFFVAADKIASDPRMANRQDMGMYREYRAARDEVLAKVGLSSLSGTSAKTQLAKKVLYGIGQQMSAQNIGFSQMWERSLAREVEPKEVTAGG